MSLTVAALKEHLDQRLDRLEEKVDKIDGRTRLVEVCEAVDREAIATLKTELNKRTILEATYTTVASVIAAVVAYFMRQPGGNP